MLPAAPILLRSALLAASLSLVGPGGAETAKQPAEESSVEVPRVEGPYLGLSVPMYFGWTHVQEPQYDYEAFPGEAEPRPENRYTLGGGFVLRYGQTLTRRFGLGFTFGFMRGRDFTDESRMGHGEVSMEFFLKPVVRRPWTLHASLGGGFGRSRLDTDMPELTFAGTLVSVFTRYAFFPGVDRYRPDKAGGFSLGPEVGVSAFLPGAWTKNSHAEILLGLWMGYFFGY
jgi:hypothetical protein